ncbi:MAG TPA: hypothetical protein VGJ83_00730 [Gemmatimonadales bacterium]|jgi:hypothetical protein
MTPDSPLGAWETFYVIVGSSAAALTGLQFVVIVLAAEARALVGAPAVQAFGTPTIVHFCIVLLISAIVSAPWPALSGPKLALGVCGAGGFVFALLVVRMARRQTGYVPVLEDWLWHATFPLIAYFALFVAALLLPRHPESSLFAIGAAALLLLYIGIHNAWDAVTYIALRERHGEKA